MNGYNEIAGLQGSYPRLSIFRRFLPLNARNLLCLQAEIVDLEAKLRVAIESDRNAADPLRQQFEYNISAMKGPPEQETFNLQWTRTLEMRRLLKEYNEALYQWVFLLKLPPVNEHDLGTLHELLEKPAGDGEPFLTYHEFATWDEENIKDLTSVLGRHTERDSLSKFLDQTVQSVYHKYVGHKLHNPIEATGVWAGARKHK
ncbi:uncharacterized protein PV07_12643, partial [Cladophialophora immunda]